MDSAFEGWNKTLEEVAGGTRPSVLKYKNTGGQLCCNEFFEVVIELVSHGAHHRGQVALLLRQAGHCPAKSTDFVPALRNSKF
jgi:hypothetical protein